MRDEDRNMSREARLVQVIVSGGVTLGTLTALGKEVQKFYRRNQFTLQ